MTELPVGCISHVNNIPSDATQAMIKCHVLAHVVKYNPQQRQESSYLSSQHGNPNLLPSQRGGAKGGEATQLANDLHNEKEKVQNQNFFWILLCVSASGSEEEETFSLSELSIAAALALVAEIPQDYKTRREAAILELEQRGQKRVRFGNDMEKLEKEVIRNCRLLRVRADRKALRRKALEKAHEEKEYIELRSGRPPMFWIPLRVHAVWERMEVTLACTVLASPPPQVTWYKNGVRIDPRLAPAGKYQIKNQFGMLTLHISRCSTEDSAEYSVEVKNQYGEAYSFATVLVRKYYGMESGFDSEIYRSQTYQFRVKAVNKEGISHPSKTSDPVTTYDPSKDKRVTVDNIALFDITVIPYDEGRTIEISKDDLEGHIRIPLPPTNVHASEVREDYVALAWDEPDPRGRDPLNYYVEKTVYLYFEQSNTNIFICSPRFTVPGLQPGKEYVFCVKSVSEAGLSESSPETDPIVVRPAIDLEKLLKRSHEIRNPLIKLISGWNVDVLEKGEVRLWLEVEKLSPNAELHLIFNDKELTSTPVCLGLFWFYF
ncbi:hypothetical protein llap_16500 [Limosa lapponica baueri]|uniref:Myomesin-2 n=1 Tax=Limosa lapponica baueri TaxID=1758121 RepID=A0A2I0THC0_LIMLA|nr:hypothetical protein llap_16500 [Limosa lapponica baueri]